MRFRTATSSYAMPRQAFQEPRLERSEPTSSRQECMRASRSEKIVLVLAIIYGAFTLLMVAPMYLFSSQQSQSLLMRLAGGAYCLTLLPAALVGLRWRKASGIWMLSVSAIAVVALWASEITRYRPADGILSLILSLAWWALIASIPGFFGLVLVREKRA